MTWFNYALIVGTLLIIYFSAVWFKILRPKGIQLSRKKKHAPSPFFEENPEALDTASGDDLQDEEDLTMSDQSIDELESLLAQVKAMLLQQYDSKALLLVKLKNVFANHPKVNHPAYRFSVNEFIAMQSESVGTVRLSEEEVDELWFVG